jgi:hypothetical protein
LSGSYAGFQGYLEVEKNEVFGNNRFNGIGRGEGDPTKSTIADAESSDFNQAYLTYSTPLLQFKLGRQDISIGNDALTPLAGTPFIGPIDFRQNGQNFDALTVTAKPTERVELFYSWVYNVNSLFGTRSEELDFDSRSHFVQATYSVADFLNVRGFGYLLDFKRDGLDAPSTNTTGVSLTGSRTLGGWTLGYRTDYARQTDAANSPLDFRSRYHFVRGTVTRGFITIGGGQEGFGDHNGVGVSNILETTYKDLIVATPSNGIVDNFAFISLPLPGGVGAVLQYHGFRSYSDAKDYGEQVELLAQRRLSERFSVLLRAFNYRDEDAPPAGSFLPPDTFRYSFQIDYRFN